MTKKSPTVLTNGTPQLSEEAQSSFKEFWDYWHNPSGIYPIEVFKRLCSDHKIPKENEKQFFATLDNAAKMYLSNNEFAEKLPSDAKLRQKFKKMHKATSLFLEQYKELIATDAGVYRHAEFELYEEVLESVGPRDMDYGDIGASLSFLLKALERAVKDLGSEKGGRPSNDALYTWVKSISRFWVKILKREYRVLGYDGAAVSKETGKFLTDCLFLLNSKDINKLDAQMRKFKATLKN